MALTKRIVKHLQLSKYLLGFKVQQWTGREPFPGDPLGTYKRMIGDIDLELHDVEIGGDKVMSRRVNVMLGEYKSLLLDVIGFHTEFGNKKEQGQYEDALTNLEDLLSTYKVQDAPDQPRTVAPARRPNSVCNEKGLCQIKVTHDPHRTDVPQVIDGEWTFGSPKTYGQERECLNCGRKWTNSIRQGTVGPAQEVAKSNLLNLG